MTPGAAIAREPASPIEAAIPDIGLSRDDRVRLGVALTAAFGDLGGAAIAIRQMSGGFSLSSKMFDVEIGGRRGVVRLVVRPDRSLDWQAEACRLLAAEGLGPRPLHISADGRVQVLAYIADESPKWHARMRPGMAETLARALRRLHGIDRRRGHANLEIAPSGLPHDSRARVSAVLDAMPGFEFVRLALDTLGVMERRLGAPCIAHNDLHAGNVLFDGAAFHFIDLEAIGFGEPSLDLAVLCHTIARNPGVEEAFLRTYFGGPLTDAASSRLLLAKTVSALRYGISSFSNCTGHAGLADVDIAAIRTYADHDDAAHGGVDLSTDAGWYRLCLMLLKLGFDYATGPDFAPAMAVLTPGHPVWVSDRAPDDDGPPRLTEVGGPGGAELIAVARLLRDITGSGGGRSTERARPLPGFEELTALLGGGATAWPCHGALSPAHILIAEEGGLCRAWLAARETPASASGPPFVDLAMLSLHLELSPAKELFLLSCLSGGAVTPRRQAIYLLTKQAARERLLAGLCETSRDLPPARLARIARASEETRRSAAHARARAHLPRAHFQGETR
jgi:aminoglycoside phosphotransferase (APT) family kinase protein